MVILRNLCHFCFRIFFANGHFTFSNATPWLIFFLVSVLIQVKGKLLIADYLFANDTLDNIRRLLHPKRCGIHGLNVFDIMKRFTVDLMILINLHHLRPWQVRRHTLHRMLITYWYILRYMLIGWSWRALRDWHIAFLREWHLIWNVKTEMPSIEVYIDL